MCTDTAIHRRQAGQECSWTNTDCETTAAPRFTTPLFGLFIVCCPWCLFPLYLSIYQSCHHFYLCLVILCCHARVSVWFPFFSILPLLTMASKFNFCSQLVLSSLWGYCSETQLITETSKRRMMWLLEPHPGWSFLSGSYKRWGLDIDTLHNQKNVHKTKLLCANEFSKANTLVFMLQVRKCFILIKFLRLLQLLSR